MNYIQSVRNVNEALSNLLHITKQSDQWRTISPRGLETIEWKGVFVTEYTCPQERVLFHSGRDCNPFFHIMEAMWILAGRSDVAFLAKYNPRMADYSDNGVDFHAPYGYRLRSHFGRTNKDWRGESMVDLGVDQLLKAADMLRRDPDTRQVVLGIWDPEVDLGAKTKDVPCNDLLMVKVRDGKLNLTVACRSNDAIWGALGANAVQFSFIQEWLACAAGVGIGTYTQISDSFHIYTDNAAWKKTVDVGQQVDPYQHDLVRPFTLMQRSTDPLAWLHQCRLFCDGDLHAYDGDIDPWFTHVVIPIAKAWDVWQTARYESHRNDGIMEAIQILGKTCVAEDWRYACMQWLERRIH